MGKIMVVYASMTGNTEAMAKYITEGIKELNNEVDLKDSLLVTPDDLLAYDGIVVGAYSWDGIPDEMLDLYEGLADIDLSGKKAAVFGSGDTAYGDDYCIAVDVIMDQLQERGAELILEGLKIELTPINDDIEKCKEFGRQFVKGLNK